MFSGQLYYEHDESNRIEVKRFIEHGDSVSFSMTTTWDGAGTFRVDAHARNADGYFTTGPVFSINSFGKEVKIPTVIRLQIMGRTKTEITVVGEWIEKGECYPFEGELAISNKR